MVRTDRRNGQVTNDDELRLAREDVLRQQLVDVHAVTDEQLVGKRGRDPRAGADERGLVVRVAPEGPQKSIDRARSGVAIHGIS